MTEEPERIERRTPSWRELAAVSERIERSARSLTISPPIPREEPEDEDEGAARTPQKDTP